MFQAKDLLHLLPGHICVFQILRPFGAPGDQHPQALRVQGCRNRFLLLSPTASLPAQPVDEVSAAGLLHSTTENVTNTKPNLFQRPWHCCLSSTYDFSNQHYMLQSWLQLITNNLSGICLMHNKVLHLTCFRVVTIIITCILCILCPLFLSHSWYSFSSCWLLLSIFC